MPILKMSRFYKSIDVYAVDFIKSIDVYRASILSIIRNLIVQHECIVNS